jgi:hypothetical protein
MSKSTLSIAVSKDVKSGIQDIAESKDLSKSEVAYQILKDELEDHNRTIPKLVETLVKNSAVIGFVWLLLVLLLDFSALNTLLTGLLVLGLLVYSVFFYD